MLGRNHFSHDEQVIIDILGDRKMTITELVNAYFEKTSRQHLSPNNYIGGVVRRIEEKCNYYGLNWTLTGEGSGRGGRTVWKIRRKNAINRRDQTKDQRTGKRDARDL